MAKKLHIPIPLLVQQAIITCDATNAPEPIFQVYSLNRASDAETLREQMMASIPERFCFIIVQIGDDGRIAGTLGGSGSPEFNPQAVFPMHGTTEALATLILAFRMGNVDARIRCTRSGELKVEGV